jgi:hypothetical protein
VNPHVDLSLQIERRKVNMPVTEQIRARFASSRAARIVPAPEAPRYSGPSGTEMDRDTTYQRRSSTGSSLRANLGLVGSPRLTPTTSAKTSQLPGDPTVDIC